MKNLLFLCLFFILGCQPILPLENPFGHSGSQSSTTPQRLSITVLDVGQGDATLIRGPNGKTLLIDAGRANSGISVILPELEKRGVDHLDWILATHYDADHIGGFSEIVRGNDQRLGTEDDLFPTEAWIDRGESTDKTSASYEDYLAVLPENRTEATPGMTLNLGNGAEAEVIVVNGHYRDGTSVHLNPDEENEASIGLLIRYGAFRYFTAGDLPGGGAPGGFETKDLETQAGKIVGDVAILHVGHHGSLSSSNTTFLQSLSPEVIVVSVGADNDYGHPHPSVLQRIEDLDAELFRTDLQGTIEILSNGTEYRLTPSDFE